MFKEELIIIRHARSKHNVKESDNLDDTITNFGFKQAMNVSKFIEEMNLVEHKYFTSPFLRCLDTASVINKPFQVMHELREYLNHSARECFVPNRKDKFPKFNWDWFSESGATYCSEFNESFLHRMHDAYVKLPQKSVVVTHGLPALVLINIAKGNCHSIPVWDYSIDNCSITILKNGRTIWHGRNLHNESDYKSSHYGYDSHLMTGGKY